MARKEGRYRRIQLVLRFCGTSTRKFIGFVALGLMLALVFVPVSHLKAIGAGTEALPLPGMAVHQEIAQSTSKNLIDQGKDYYQAGQFDQAAEVWQAAANIYSEDGRVLNQSLALSYLSLAYQKQGKWPEAQEAIAQSLDLLPNQDTTATESQRRVRALALNNQGLLFLAVGKAKAAFQVWEQAAIRLWRCQEWVIIGDRAICCWTQWEWRV